MSIQLKDVSFSYMPNTQNAVRALDHINLEIGADEFVGLIGHTGSGKSTLVQLLNGLLKPTEGEVWVDGKSTGDVKSLKKIRSDVGLVFQYPEYQLFEETVEKDIAFGPKNMGVPEEEIRQRVEDIMNLLGLPYEEYKDKSPFELSGGQKRRVAIAGVLVSKPKYLVLDEPTAGLDPRGRDELFAQIQNLYEREKDLTIILVSHSMDDVARLVNRILVMDRAHIAMDDTPLQVFSREEELSKMGLDIPQITKIMRRLKERGWDVNTDILSVDEAFLELKRYQEVRNGK